ncbi:MAG: hypothetical protein COV31_02010 [Candidatus Yanofskybacteria bacterium CG10_big_fil_rev_8_21_14_0_10_46_23]|uniref:Uncharacterized protein n=1 Tax=Candidatus Yanofskybacteria bacterium CG10_big_fil_rev_8_21_14_0_10_46_23 TaxID=1975098 RepID=A0A2H0R564_9BACT|nr:MAG: hypothetical protein COV31_02010 [Candidatus Yanofskybacteria bacterium CG10_big_fil_rev_8_21_14_0_10_46_23]
MKWGHPPIIKIYEALGAIADGRIKVSGDTAKVYSSSGNKFYTVTYNPEKRAIMANDNGSYWKGYLGYPAIAFLFEIEALGFKQDMADLLKGLKWKDLNQRFKNDFDKTLTFIEESLSPNNKMALSAYAHRIEEDIKNLGLKLLGAKIAPPNGY